MVIHIFIIAGMNDRLVPGNLDTLGLCEYKDVPCAPGFDLSTGLTLNPVFAKKTAKQPSVFMHTVEYPSIYHLPFPAMMEFYLANDSTVYRLRR
jgi:hypothetical protein